MFIIIMLHIILHFALHIVCILHSPEVSVGGPDRFHGQEVENREGPTSAQHQQSHARAAAKGDFNSG